jgi:hypothetical protein
MDTGQQDGAWTLRAARQVTTDGASCGLHGYQDCGICAPRAERWLLTQIDTLAAERRATWEAAAQTFDRIAELSHGYTLDFPGGSQFDHNRWLAQFAREIARDFRGRGAQSGSKFDQVEVRQHTPGCAWNANLHGANLCDGLPTCPGGTIL